MATVTPPPIKEKKGTAPKRRQYFGAYQRLGPQLYFYRPTAETSATKESIESQSEPDLIIMCSWMAASARHVEKYTDQYLKRYATIPMLLIRSSELDILFKRERLQVNELEPAVRAIRSILASIDRPPKVLLHIFSNGGSWSATMLSRAYEKLTGGSMLPVSALVLDSCPSFPRMKLSHRALSMVLPTQFPLYQIGWWMLWIFLFLIRIFNQLHVTENLILTVRHALNDPTGPFVKGGAPRVYICSDTDMMVPIEDIKDHADEAKETLIKAGVTKGDVEEMVRFEEFEGSSHVGHLKVGPERYWAIVEKTWEIAMGIKGEKNFDL